jgi:hypothetical protein
MLLVQPTADATVVAIKPSARLAQTADPGRFLQAKSAHTQPLSGVAVTTEWRAQELAPAAVAAE